MDDAYRGLTESVSRYRNEGASRELVRALRALSEVERDLGRNDEALKLYEEGVVVSRAEGDSLLLAHTIRHLGQLHHDAARLWEEARDLYEACDIQPGVEECSELLARLNSVRP